MISFRTQFSPGYDFVVVRDVVVDNTRYRSGERFDKRVVSARTLRQLYEARYLDIAKSESAAPQEAPAPRQRRRRFRDGSS